MKNAAFLVFVVAWWCGPGLFAEEQFHLVSQTNTHADVQANGSPAAQDGTTSAVAQAGGHEESQCNAGQERQSGANAGADIKIDDMRETAGAFTVSARAYANGGHF